MGLRNPTGFFPAANRASLIAVIIEPTTGEEQEVPKTSSNSPSIYIGQHVMKPSQHDHHLEEERTAMT